MKQGQDKTDSLTSNDLDKIAGLLDERLAPVATKEFVKEELRGTEQHLKDYIHEGMETIMEGIDRITEQLAEKEKVEKLTEWARKASEKIGVKLEL